MTSEYNIPTISEQEQAISRRERRIIESSVLERTTGVDIDTLLMRVVIDGASDLHLSCGSLPRYRIDGSLIEMSGTDVVTDQWLRTQIRNIASDKLWEEYNEHNETDLSYSVEGYGRFRVNVFVQRGTAAAVMRTIPSKIKTIQELGVPEILHDIIKKPKGLILVTGPTGSGKSTTLTAMLDAINDTREEHIVTIEDPIEFVHTNKKSLVNQREVGSDTKSFNEALKRVLRQDPDVILIGEMRDAETISTALTAAETGHLVFGTLHTQSATKTIDRIIDTFPAHQQNQVRSQLSDTLQAVICQSLIKRINGGRVAATEILINNSAVANNIREGNLTNIYSALQTGRTHGMHTFDQDFVKLVKAGIVSKDEVINMMVDPKTLNGIMSTTNDWT